MPDVFNSEQDVIVGRLSAEEQTVAVAHIRAAVRHAPLWRPRMRSGAPMHVQVTGMGETAWTADEQGVCCTARHPVKGMSFLPIPPMLLEVSAHFGLIDPDACRIAYFDADEHDRWGLHQDRAGTDMISPVVYVTLGAACRFQFSRSIEDPVRDLNLLSGDVVVLTGRNRFAWHGISKVFPGSGPAGLLSNSNQLVCLSFRRVWARNPDGTMIDELPPPGI